MSRKNSPKTNSINTGLPAEDPAFSEELMEALELLTGLLGTSSGLPPYEAARISGSGLLRIVLLHDKKPAAVSEFAKSPEARERLKSGQELLSSLRKQGFERCPSIMGFKENEHGMLLMTSLPEKMKPYQKKRLTLTHYQTLVELNAYSGRATSFSETAYAKKLNRLTKNFREENGVCSGAESEKPAERNREEQICRLAEEIRCHEEAYESVTYSACYGSFAEDLFLTENGLFLPDWTKAEEGCPPYFDAFDFIIKRALSQGKSAEKIYKKDIRHLLKELSGLTDEGEFLLKEYLVMEYLKTEDAAEKDALYTLLTMAQA